MLYMNDYEIREAQEVLARRQPKLLPYAKFLDDWRETVDNNSDGWAHWKGGPKAATRLMSLIKTVVEIERGFKDRASMPKEVMFRSALTPIRSAATKHGWAAPVLAEVPEADAPAPGFR